MVSTRTTHARRLFAGLPATYERVASVLSFGQDPRWRAFLVSRIPADAARVLDVAAGTGAVTRMVTRPGRHVVALDQSEPMLREAARRAVGSGDRPAFVLAQGERPPFPPATFDAVTFTYLLRYVDDPAEVLRGLVDVVTPGGTIASLEFGVPPARVWRGAWWLYTRAVLPLAGRLVSREWFDVGRFLGPSISSYVQRYPLEEQLRIWRTAGVHVAGVRRMSLGGGVVIWGVRAT